MLNSLYLARMDCAETGSGNNGHLDPISITELNVRNVRDFKPRQYRRVGDGTRLASGFGFVFGPETTRGLHKARVMVLDFSQWKVRHLIHFISKYFILLSNK